LIHAITFVYSFEKKSIMYTINVYFNFMGNTEEAMNFYKSVFGGEFTGLSRFKDLPGSEKIPAHEQNKIMHITLTTKNGTNIMATDFLESMEQKFEPLGIDRQIDVWIPPVNLRQRSRFGESLVEIEHRRHVVMRGGGGSERNGKPKGQRDLLDHRDCLRRVAIRLPVRGCSVRRRKSVDGCYAWHILPARPGSGQLPS
jgi:hypothetical protein